MAITNDGREYVLDGIKTGDLRIRLYGENDGQSWSSGSQTPTFTGTTSLSLSSSLTFSITNVIDLLVVQGARLTDSTGTIIYFEKAFASSFNYSVDGNFTLTQYNVAIS